MFNNPGRQLKSLATAIFWVEVVSAAILGLIVMALLSELSLLLRVTVLAIIVAYGVLIGWLSGILLYTFGDMAHDLNQVKSLIEIQVGIEGRRNPNYTTPQAGGSDWSQPY